jgi:hypothetical protein
MRPLISGFPNEVSLLYSLALCLGGRTVRSEASEVTANLSAFFVESKEEKEERETDRKLDLILQRLDALEKALQEKQKSEE